MCLERPLNRRSSFPHANLEIGDPIGNVTCGNNFLLGRLPSHLSGHNVSFMCCCFAVSFWALGQQLRHRPRLSPLMPRVLEQTARSPKAPMPRALTLRVSSRDTFTIQLSPRSMEAATASFAIRMARISLL